MKRNFVRRYQFKHKAILIWHYISVQKVLFIQATAAPEVIDQQSYSR